MSKFDRMKDRKEGGILIHRDINSATFTEIFLYFDRSERFHTPIDEIGLGLCQPVDEPMGAVKPYVRIKNNDSILINVDQCINPKGRRKAQVIVNTTSDIEENVQSICDVYWTAISESKVLDDNTKREIIQKLDRMREMLDIERQRAKKILDDELNDREKADREKKFEEIIDALVRLRLSEDELMDLMGRVQGISALEQINGEEQK